jgi:hypothetical protein
VQSLSSRQPSELRHCDPLRSEHGVGEPTQYGLPDPAPVRSHQPAPPQRVSAGQSLSSRQRATQISAPMHIVSSPHAAVHASDDVHGIVHCRWPM